MISSSDESSMTSLDAIKRPRTAETECVDIGDVVRVRVAGIVGMRTFYDGHFIVFPLPKNKKRPETKNPVAHVSH